MRFRDRPIRTKILVIVVSTSAAALILSVTLSLLYGSAALHERFARNRLILTQITANNLTAALAFQNPRDGQEVLEGLGGDPSILSAEIVTTDGRVFASYQHPSAAVALEPPRVSRDEVCRMDAGTLVSRAEIETESRTLGTVYVRSDMSAIDTFLVLDGIISAGLAVFACLLAAGAAALLQRSISRPVRELSDVADRITRDERHRGRATKLGDDEIGHLVDSFNGMLDRVRQREIALEKSEANYRMLTEQASDGILLWSADQLIQFANPAACEMFGYSESELRGRSIPQIFGRDGSGAHPPTPDELHDSKSILSEGSCLRKDGSQLWTETRSRMLDDGRVQSIVRDLSDRHEMEAQLRQSQRMEAVGRLAGGVAHDFNNMLMVILNGCELVLLRGGLDPKAAAEINQVKSAGNRAATLTRQLLAFSRQQVLQPTVLNLNCVVREVEGMLLRLLGEDIRFETSLSPGLGNVTADPNQLEQVLVNLAVNARDAMPDGGKIHITTRNLELEQASEGTPPGSYVVLAVQDSGDGMDEQELTRIFDPFYTTKPLGEGTGLGLATVYGTVQQSGGHIAVASSPGAGTCFTIYLPRVAGEKPTEPAHRPETGVSQGFETILVVEDDDLVRRQICDMLGSRGYEVREASDGIQALELTRDAEAGIDLVITDFVMPGISGLELGERLSEQHPDLPILYISGYANDDLSRRGLAKSGEAFLSKPFSVDELTEKLRSLLGHS